MYLGSLQDFAWLLSGSLLGGYNVHLFQGVLQISWIIFHREKDFQDIQYVWNSEDCLKEFF